MPVFIKNDWYMAAWTTEVTSTPLARKIAGESVVLFRDQSGAPRALEDRCCHRGVALSLGSVVPGGIQCGYHGMVFDGSGTCVHIPGQDNIPAKACVRHFAVEERDGMIWMWLGEASRADPGRIISYPYHGNPEVHSREGLVHVKCNYEMMLDNAMDLTHLAYVHAETLSGNDKEVHAKALMTTERTDRGVKFTRWLLNVEPPPLYRNAAGAKGCVDRWQELELITPCTLIGYNGGVDVSQNAYEGGSREGGFGLRILHLIVPETETTCHYFYTVADGSGANDRATADRFFEMTRPVLLEDKVFVESQQAVELERPNGTFVDLKSDLARVLYNRHLKERLAAEMAENAQPTDRSLAQHAA